MTATLSRRHFLAFTSAALATTTLGMPAHAASGRFAGQGRYDVSGSATVQGSGAGRTITLSGDFRSTSGPDLYVYVGNGSASTRIARLSSTRGSQTYRVPASVGAFSTVHIHCRRFSSTFGTARLR